jgi:hypothetical protein
MANEPRLDGGPVWHESAWAFDAGCRLTGLANVELGRVLPMWAGREGAVSDETITRWRKGATEVPFWAMRGLWRRLRTQGGDAEALRLMLGFGFAD